MRMQQQTTGWEQSADSSMDTTNLAGAMSDYVSLLSVGSQLTLVWCIM